MKSIRLAPILFSLLCLLGVPPRGLAQSTAFTYQGRLQDGGNAPTGLYDFEFRLFNAVSGGTQQGPTLTLNDLGVTNGLFLAALDFGANFPGADRFLQLSVRPGASVGAYALLSPRQPITATPYAIRAVEAAGLPAGAVSGAMLADGAVTATKIAPGAVSQLGASDGSPVNAVQVNTNGLVGVGTNAPQAGLHIASGREFNNLELIEFIKDGAAGFNYLGGASAVATEGTLVAVGSHSDSSITLVEASTNSLSLTAQFRNGDSGFAGLGQVVRVALRSNVLVAATSEGTVSLIDVSNRYAPVLRAQLHDGQGGWNELLGINGLAFSGNLLAIAARYDNAVTLVDVANPANPIKRAEIKDGFFGFTNLWGASTVAFKGNYLFIGAAEDEAVTVVDVSTPGNPIKVTELRAGVGGFSSFGFVLSMAVAGNTLAVGSGVQLALVDVANPAAPVPGAVLTLDTQPAVSGGVNGLAASGNLLAVAPRFLSRAIVLDVAQAASPRIHTVTDRVAGPEPVQNTYAAVAFLQGSNLVFSIQDVGAVSYFKSIPRSSGLISSGWVGIGVSQPSAALHVAGDVVVESADEFRVDALAVNFSHNGVATGAYSVVGGGVRNRATAEYAAVAGGFANQANAGEAFVGGGEGNLASGYASVIAGGQFNLADTNHAAIGGGFMNRASGWAAVVPGGYGNVADGDFSAALGLYARAYHGGSFVWGDSQNSYFDSTTTNQFSVRANGGVRLETAGAGLTVDGQKVLTVTTNQLNVLATGGVHFETAGAGLMVDGQRVLTTAGGNQPLELTVGGQRALRLEPTTGTPNFIGGYSNNIVNIGVVGAVIAGGGGDWLSQTYPHRVGGDYASVLGGLGNVAAGTVSTAFGNQTKALGANSTAFGSGTVASGQYSVAMGGATSAGGRSATAMGENTVANGSYATAIGVDSTASGESSLAAGRLVRASGTNSLALGYRANAQHAGSFVWADRQDFDFASTAANQFNLRASGGVRLNNDTSLNFGNETRQMLNLWTAEYGIGVQSSTTYFRSGGNFSWFRGGSHVDGSGDPGAGGSALMRLTSGGNLGLGHNAPAYPLDVQAGQAVGRFTSTNTVNGSVLVLQNSTASPTYLGAINFDSASSTPGQIGYLASDDMAFRVGGTERMRLNSGGLTVNGTFVSASDRNVKEDFAAVDAQEVLNKVAALPLQSWSYTNRPGVKHVGPMAQDFRAAFGLGEDDKHIATVDADGVALAAIQGLNQRLTEELKRRDSENAELKKSVADLKELVERLASARKQP